HGGLGIGLAIAREIVALHKGTIHASSAGLGQGSTFSVRIPLPTSGDGAARHDEQPAKPTLAAETHTLEGMRILVVEDDIDSREMLELILQHAGAETRGCGTVADAIREMDVWRPNVLVSDIGLPGENGYDLIRHVRALDP